MINTSVERFVWMTVPRPWDTRVWEKHRQTSSVCRGVSQIPGVQGIGADRHKGTVEYFTPMANTCPRGDSHHQLEGMFKKVRPARPQPFWRAERTLST